VISKPVGKNNIMKHSSAENTQKRKAEEKKRGKEGITWPSQHLLEICYSGFSQRTEAESYCNCTLC
jgi:hypothetical protein